MDDDDLIETLTQWRERIRRSTVEFDRMSTTANELQASNLFSRARQLDSRARELEFRIRDMWNQARDAELPPGYHWSDSGPYIYPD